jgi:allantoinase
VVPMVMCAMKWKAVRNKTPPSDPNGKSVMNQACPTTISTAMTKRYHVFTGNNVVVPGHDQPQPATVIVDLDHGKIDAVLPGKRTALGDDYDELEIEWVEVDDKFLILPGLIECVRFGTLLHPSSHLIFSAHVHLNEPGRTDWEGFWTGTRAAASGGVTTVVDMPLNSIPPTTTLHHLEAKRRAAQGQCWVDVAFWGGVIPGNQVLPSYHIGKRHMA